MPKILLHSSPLAPSLNDELSETAMGAGSELKIERGEAKQTRFAPDSR